MRYCGWIMHEAKKVRFAPFSSRSTCTRLSVSMYTHSHVCVRVYINRETSRWWSLRPSSRGSSPSTFPAFSYAFLFATLLNFPPLSPPLSPFFSLALFVISMSTFRLLLAQTRWEKWICYNIQMAAVRHFIKRAICIAANVPRSSSPFSIARSLATSTDGRRSFLVADQTETSTTPD